MFHKDPETTRFFPVGEAAIRRGHPPALRPVRQQLESQLAVMSKG